MEERSIAILQFFCLHHKILTNVIIITAVMVTDRVIVLIAIVVSVHVTMRKSKKIKRKKKKMKEKKKTEMTKNENKKNNSKKKITRREQMCKCSGEKKQVSFCRLSSAGNIFHVKLQAFIMLQGGSKSVNN